MSNDYGYNPNSSVRDERVKSKDHGLVLPLESMGLKDVYRLPSDDAIGISAADAVEN